MEKHLNESLITRRTLLLGAGKLGLTALILGRMYYLQIIEAKKYQLLADKNRISWRFKAALRGRILDCQGHEIALNDNAYCLVLSHGSQAQLKKILAAVEEIIPLSDAQKERISKDLKRNPAYIPTIIKDNLSWEEVTQIELHAADLPGVYIDVGHKRLYPHKELFAPLLGYVSLPTKEDIEQDPLAKLPSLRVGRQGVEKAYHDLLKGEPEHEQLEVNALNKVVRKLSGHPGKAGGDLPLTVDLKLQQQCYELLIPHHSASCIVMDVRTGAIKAMVSLPSFDPNFFVDGISHENWHHLQHDPLLPLRNKAICALYPPGSTFKMVVALAALEAGVVSPETRVHCPGHFILGNHTFHCWQKHGHGSVNLHHAIAGSCDTYFYDLSLKAGADRIAEMARRLGFGEITGIDLPNEKAGLVPDPKWKKSTKKHPWVKGDTVNYGIGQGYLTSTPLQLATMTAMLANGGHRILPHVGLSAHEPISLDLHQEHLSLVLDGMYAVVNRPYGTAFTSRLFGKFEMAGKTGSAQVRRITLEERRLGLQGSMSRPWEHREHALFVGFAPYDAPRYAVAVVVEHGGSGTRTAAPLAQKIMQAALTFCPLHKG